MKTKVTAEAKADVATVISKALEIFGPTGEHWLQGGLRDGRGNFCMLGGLERAGARLRVGKDLVDEAKIAVAQTCPGWSNRKFSGGGADIDVARSLIPGFNDAIGRDYEEIKDIMCKALQKQLRAKRRRR